MIDATVKSFASSLESCDGGERQGEADVGKQLWWHLQKAHLGTLEVEELQIDHVYHRQYLIMKKRPIFYFEKCHISA